MQCNALVGSHACAVLCSAVVASRIEVGGKTEGSPMCQFALKNNTTLHVNKNLIVFFVNWGMRRANAGLDPLIHGTQDASKFFRVTREDCNSKNPVVLAQHTLNGESFPRHRNRKGTHVTVGAVTLHTNCSSD